MTRLRQQRRGKGSSNYKCHKPFKILTYLDSIDTKNYTLTALLRDPIKNTVIGKYLTNEKEYFYNLAPLTSYVGQNFNGSIQPGQIKKLKDIPPGSAICNIALNPNAHGKMIRTAGVVCKIIKKEENIIYVKVDLRIIKCDVNSFATVGIPGGGGHTLKPILKAGVHMKIRKGTGKFSKTVTAKAKNHHEHPFGASTSKSPGRPKTSSRHAPPGQKVGSIAAKRTGRK